MSLVLYVLGDSANVRFGVIMDTLITAKFDLTRAVDAISKCDWPGGLSMLNNFHIALHKAMKETGDDDIYHFYIVNVESFDCIVHLRYTWGYSRQSFDKYVYPFDENTVYPVKQLVVKPVFYRD